MTPFPIRAEDCAHCSSQSQNRFEDAFIKNLWNLLPKAKVSRCPPPGRAFTPLPKFKVSGIKPSGVLISHAQSFTALDSCDAPNRRKNPQSLNEFLKSGGDVGINWNLIINGSFIGWADHRETIPLETVAPVVHQGKILSMGNGNLKAWFRGAVAALTDGRMVICRIKKSPKSMGREGWRNIDYLRDACGLSAGPGRQGPDIQEFEGGGGLLIDQGEKVQDLYEDAKSKGGQSFHLNLLLPSDLILAAQKSDGSVDFMSWYGKNTDPLVSAEAMCNAGYESAVAFDNSSGFYRKTRHETLGDYTKGGTCLGFAIQEKKPGRP